MKRKWHHPEEDPSAKTLIRSIGDLQDSPERRQRRELEFPKEVESMRDEEDRELSRRGFMKFMGASTALAGLGLAACRRPVGHIVPYSKSVEWIVPGKPLLYTSAMPRVDGCTPVLATTHEGRPTHLQGNPLHPSNPGGGTDSFASSAILDLYDPERSGEFKNEGVSVEQSAFDAFFTKKKQQLAADGGKGLAILHGQTPSPTRARLLAEMSAKLAGAKAFAYEPLTNTNAHTAVEAAFGEGARQLIDFSKAQRVLSLGSDFLGLERPGEASVAQFAAARNVDGEGGAKAMNRLYVMEHAFTLTGGMADHRLPVPASQILAAAALVAEAVGAAAGIEVDAAAAGIDPTWVETMVADLTANKGSALVVAGPRQPAAVHALALAINEKLGAFGSLIKVVKSDAPKSGTLEELAAAIKAGEVSTLVITTPADPAYDAPADLGFAGLLESVETVIHVSPRNLCATARAATWQVPGTHFLEEWGDTRASDGTYSVIQPMILPLYGGISELNFLASLTAEEPAEGAQPAGSGDAALDAVKATFATIAEAAGAGKVDAAWNQTLRDGFLPNTQFPPAGAADFAALAPLTEGAQLAPMPASGSFEVVFTADSKVWDGRYINNGWQQECPDPISKIVWDNAALVSHTTLRELGLSEKELVIEDKTRLIRVTVNGVKTIYPVIPAPGHVNHALSISMGYGQEDAGKVAGSNDGSGTGFDCFPQRTTASTYFASGATVELVEEKVVARAGLEASETYPIALTQEHNSMEGRALVRDASAVEFDKDPAFVKHRGMDSHVPPNKPIYKGQDFDYENDHQWGMTVDLNACIGCSACTIACQSENNIPIVGKEQVIIGREMHWIRMDRYFAPTEADEEALANPEMLMQPVACQQCEAAPCETVCPVNATVHTEEGLNAMAYNRCIGTRYCMNNCPYKARRFNFFDYNKRPVDQLYKGPLSDKDQTGMRESHKLQKNPNVTVRMRGVVEKCTYCVQRLQEAKYRQKRKAKTDGSDLRIPTDSVKSACQQACPANAIEFGDLANQESKVVKMKALPRSYDMLGYLGVRPRTSFLGRIKNPNEKMPGGDQVGKVARGAAH